MFTSYLTSDVASRSVGQYYLIINYSINFIFICVQCIDLTALQ